MFFLPFLVIIMRVQRMVRKRSEFPLTVLSIRSARAGIRIGKFRINFNLFCLIWIPIKIIKRNF